MQLKIKHPLEWATNSGYEIKCTDDAYRGEVKLVYCQFSAFNIGSMEVAKSAYRNPYYIHAKDAKLLVVNNDRSNLTHNYRYFIISKEGDLLADEHLNRSFWLQFFNFFKFINADTIVLDENRVSSSILLPASQEYAFVGGHAHFGHWLADHLPIILFFEKNKIKCNSFHYLTSLLNSFQIESLQECAVEGKISQLNFGTDYLSIVDVPDLHLLVDLSVFQSYEMLRSKLCGSMMQPPIATPVHGVPKRKVYLERGVQRGLNRLSNESEVIDLLKGYGFDIIKPHELSLATKKKMFSEFDLFVCPPGSAFFNFHIFSKKSAHLLYCVQETVLNNMNDAVFGGTYYQCPDLYRTSLLIAEQKSVTNFGAPQYDAACHIPIEELKAKLLTLI